MLATPLPLLARALAGWVLVSCALGAAAAQDPQATAAGGLLFVQDVDREDYADLADRVSRPEDLRAGLFPEDLEPAENRRDRDRCERIVSAGYKCQPPQRSYTRYSLPGASFALGSAELPDLMRQQLRAFAEVLKGRQASAPAIRIDGHADASGNEQTNRVLSHKRAESVRDYLVNLGVSAGLLAVEGHGSKMLRNAAAPTAAENRRVEIARKLAP